MRQGCPKQRHKTVAEELVDGAFIAVHSVECQGEEAVQQGVHVFWTKTLGQDSGVRQVAEQHRHLFAFALQGTAGGEDFLGEVRWSVGERLAFLRAGGRRG
jgi:hypothetical protein